MRSKDIIQKDLTDLYHFYVMRTGTFDTGALYGSIDVKIAKSGLSVSVDAIYYLPFLDKGTKYIPARHITDQWMNDPKWDELMAELVEIWASKYTDDSVVKKVTKQKRK